MRRLSTGLSARCFAELDEAEGVCPFQHGAAAVQQRRGRRRR
jgi:hypothetical protein